LQRFDESEFVLYLFAMIVLGGHVPSFTWIGPAA